MHPPLPSSSISFLSSSSITQRFAHITQHFTMSSLRVRTKNKVLSAFGATKPSTNVAFDLAYSDFESTVQRLNTFDAALKAYATSIEKNHTTAMNVVSAIEHLSTGGTGTASFQHQPIGVSNMQQMAEKVRNVCVEVERAVLDETAKDVDYEVVRPVKGWLQHAHNVQQGAILYQEKKALYDHYSRKVGALREAHEKRLGSGRSEKTKESDRLARNEQKLATTTQDYTLVADTVIRDLRAFVLSRDAALAPLLRRVLRGRIQYAERMQSATNHMRILIEDTEEDETSVVDQFRKIEQEGGRIESTALVTAATTNLTVQKASFEAFVKDEKAGKEENWMTFASSISENERQVGSFSGNEVVTEQQYIPPHGMSQFTSGNVPPFSTSPLPDRSNRHDGWLGEWGTMGDTALGHQVPIADFQDMHRAVFNGEAIAFH